MTLKESLVKQIVDTFPDISFPEAVEKLLNHYKGGATYKKPTKIHNVGLKQWLDEHP